MVEEASAFGSSGIVVVTLFGLFTTVGNTRSAVAALLTGLLSYIAGSYWLDVPAPYLTSLGLALVAYVGVGNAYRKPADRAV